VTQALESVEGIADTTELESGNVLSGISHFQKQLFFCIEEGGAISAEDALDSYLNKLFKLRYEEAEVAGVRAAILDLSQDIGATDPDTYREQRLRTHGELIRYGLVTHDLLRPDVRISLVEAAMTRADIILSTVDIASKQGFTQIQEFANEAVSHINDINRAWAEPIFTRIVPNSPIRHVLYGHELKNEGADEQTYNDYGPNVRILGAAVTAGAVGLATASGIGLVRHFRRHSNRR